MDRRGTQNRVVPRNCQRQNDHEIRKPVLGLHIPTDALRIPDHVKGDYLI